MIPVIQFNEFFKQRCPSINYWNKIIKKINDDDDDGDISLDSFELTAYTNIFPGIVRLADYCDFNICYHGRECTAHGITLYDWTDYYIVYEYDTENDDCDVLKIIHNYKSATKFFAECFTVYKKNDFDTNIFLNDIDEITFCTDVFNSIYHNEGYKYFSKFMKDKYRAHILAKGKITSK